MSSLPLTKDAAAIALGPRRSFFASILELGKFRLSVFVLMTTAFGFLLGLGDTIDLARLVVVVIGTGMVAFAANTLNQVWEIQHDRRMARTANRPLVTGDVTPWGAMFVAFLLAVGGVFLLSHGTNQLATTLALASLLSYVLLYTPLKRKHNLNTLLGAIPGALPVMIGWAAVDGQLTLAAWTLFSIIFCWQIPHFMAISWLYREDYLRAGFKMLAAEDASGRAPGRAALIYSLALVPLSMAASFVALTGWVSLLLTPVLGLVMIVPSWRFLRQPATATARALFLASLVYLPVFFLLLLVDRTRLPAIGG
ncbi:MAG: heme o synthase [Planctomycetota bacterium]